MTAICGGAMFGYIATGQLAKRREPGDHDERRDHRREQRPVDEEIRDHGTLPGSVFRAVPAAIGTALTGTARHDLERPVDDDARARRQARRHRDVVAGERAELDRAPARRWPLPSTVQTYAPCAPCITARFGITSERGMLTPSMRARTMRPGTTPSRVVEHGADRDGARRIVDARRDELDRAHGSESTCPARP